MEGGFCSSGSTASVVDVTVESELGVQGYIQIFIPVIPPLYILTVDHDFVNVFMWDSSPNKTDTVFFRI